MQSTCQRWCPKLPSPPIVTAACSRRLSFDDGRSRALTRMDLSVSCRAAGKWRLRTECRSPSTKPIQPAGSRMLLALWICSHAFPLVGDEPGFGNAPCHHQIRISFRRSVANSFWSNSPIAQSLQGEAPLPRLPPRPLYNPMDVGLALHH